MKRCSAIDVIIRTGATLDQGYQATTLYRKIIHKNQILYVYTHEITLLIKELLKIYKIRV